MHIFFSGIGGSGIGPLALVAYQAGFDVSGSDKQDSDYIEYLKSKGIADISIGQDGSQIASVHAKKPIDWFVYSSALPKEKPNHPELQFCSDKSIKSSKRDELLNYIISQRNLNLIAIAGTHGKTTTTAMAIWLFKQLSIPISYSVGAKLSFGDMGEFNGEAEYFVYEADEYDKNFLAFRPHLSLITGVAWDHPDTYPSKAEYQSAFNEFINQSDSNILWEEDSKLLGLQEADNLLVFNKNDAVLNSITLLGLVNRQDAWQVVSAVHRITSKPLEKLITLINKFPGLSRRFEELTPGLYSDYAHTPEKIKGALQTAEEKSGGNFVVVYEGLHNTRQHFIKDELPGLFDIASALYIVPSYLARENPNLELLNPDELVAMCKHKSGHSAELNDDLRQSIQDYLNKTILVLCLSAGGGGSLDEWLRSNFA